MLGGAKEQPRGRAWGKAGNTNASPSGGLGVLEAEGKKRILSGVYSFNERDSRGNGHERQIGKNREVDGKNGASRRNYLRTSTTKKGGGGKRYINSR